MSTEYRRRQRIVGALSFVFAVLIVAVGVESYAIMRLNEKLEQNQHVNATATATKKLDEGAATGQSTEPNAGENSVQNPSTSPAIDDWFQMSFNPDTWNSLAEMHQLQQRMDRMFDGTFGHFGASPLLGELDTTFTHIPRMDLHENADSYIVRFDLPGMDKSNIDVQLKDRMLTVSGTREKDLEKKEGNHVLQNEVVKGQFERSLLIPGPIKSGDMKATYKNGVLEVTVPKGNEPATSSEHIKVM